MTSMENTNRQVYEDGNNLETYLEKQMKEYTEECESMKAMYVTLMEHIKECKSQIHSLKAKEDIGFSLLSPIPVKSAFQTQSIRIEGQLEAYEKQREKYIKDIRFYESKIEEMKEQLAAYRKNEKTKKDGNMQSMEVAVAEVAYEKRELKEKTICDNQKEKANYNYIAHKISEIKGYLDVDIMRSKMEIQRLEHYISNLIK